jgi:nucleotide-binding universal stress UspA family protein
MPATGPDSPDTPAAATATTIVVGYVSKPEGRAALTAAMREARLRNAQLLVINSAVGGGALSSGEARTHEEELDEVRAELTQAGVPGTVRMYVRGQEPSQDILQAAVDSNAELVVIGLRRRTPVGKLILGSNAQRILLDAHCPVLAVKADAD